MTIFRATTSIESFVDAGGSVIPKIEAGDIVAIPHENAEFLEKEGAGVIIQEPIGYLPPEPFQTASELQKRFADQVRQNEVREASQSGQHEIMIPDQLREARFCLIRKGEKTAFEPDWEKHTYSYDDPRLLTHIKNGGNYGVISHNGICCIDIDDPQEWKKLGIRLPKSFTVGRPKAEHMHYYFKCLDCPTTERKKHITTYGDVRIADTNAYTVGPTCIHPSGDEYEIINSDLITDVTWDTIKRIIVTKGGAGPEEKKPFKILPGKLQEGERRNTLLKAGLAMHRKGISIPAIRTALITENQERCSPPLDTAVIDGLLPYIQRYIEQTPAVKTHTLVEIPEKPFQQIGGGCIDNPRLAVNLSGNFIQHYIDYVHGLSDSYIEYQHGAGLMLLSCAVNKRAYLPLTVGNIYPNFWIFGLGQSTISRKTTACTKLMEFVELQNRWMILSYPGSPEAFIEDLSGEDRVDGEDNLGHGILCRDEAAGILAAMEKTFMSDMRDLFCQLYDCRSFTRKLRSGQRKAKTMFNIKDAYLNLFFTTTPDNFSAYTKLEDLTSGWLLRFLYYYPNYERKMRDISSMTDEDRNRQKDIGMRLRGMIAFFKNHEIVFRLSIIGQSFYNEWKRQHLNQMQHDRLEDRGTFDRLSIYALKMAMLYTIGKDATYEELRPEAPKTLQMDIDDDCLRTACDHIDQYFYPISRIVFETVGRNEDRNMIEKILGTIRRAGGKITRTDLMKRVHLRKKDLDDSLESLIDSTEVQVFLDEGVTYYSL